MQERSTPADDRKPAAGDARAQPPAVLVADARAPDSVRRAQRLRRWLQYPILAALVGLVVWRTDLRAAWEVLRSIRLGWAFLAIAALVASNVLHGIKWQRLLRGVGRVSEREAIAVFWASMAVNNVLPLRAGDVLRVDVLARRNSLHRAGVFATLLTERVLDAVCFLIILLVSLSLLTSSSSDLWGIGLVLGIVAAASLGGTVYVARTDPSRPLAERPLVGQLPQQVHRLADAFLPSFVAGLRPLGHWRSGAGVVLWALGAWALECVAFALFGLAFGLEVGLANYLLVMIAVNFVSSLTILPANLGIFELAAAGILNAAGSSSGEAAAYALGSHVLVFVTISLAGIGTLPYLQLSLRQLDRGEQAVRGSRGE